MNGFKKLILTSAILAASSSAMAMQAMDEASLSDTTGQDGITINVASSNIANLDVTWIDRTGIPATTYTNPGAVVVKGVGVSITDLNINVDAGSDAGGLGQLNIDVSTAQNIVVNLNNTKIQVASAGLTGSATANATDVITFAPGASLTIGGGINANVKLGHHTGTEHLMTLSTAPAGFNVSLTGLTIVDTEATAAYDLANTSTDVLGIGIGRIGVSNVVLKNTIDVVDNTGTGGLTGLQINTAGTTIGEVALEGIKLGNQTTASSMGDVYLNGLTANTVLTIAGHP